MSRTTPGNRNILAAGTGDASSENFAVLPDMPVTIVGVGTFATDTLKLYVSYDGGTNFVQCYSAGSAKVLSATNTVETIYGPGVYKVVRTATSANALSAYILY